jgi:hypothetical protein
MKKLAVFSALALLLILAGSPIAAQSQGGPTVLESAAEVDFPARLNFTLLASSDAEITDVRLHYRVERTSFARVTSEALAEFEPASQVRAHYTLDMRYTGGFPPGTGIWYWWTVADAGGKAITTAAVRLQFDDARYPWRSVSEGLLTLYWYQGNESFAWQLMAAAQAALARLEQDTGALLTEPVALYIYNGYDDLRGAMIFPKEWTGGVAYPNFNAIVLGVSPGNVDWGVLTIAHEMAHLVVHRLTDNPYLGLPVWLDEGLAMYAQDTVGVEFIDSLDRAVKEDRLFSVRSLASSFSAFGGQASLSYAQSYSLVEFLINRYGQPRMLELLKVFSQGSDYDAALERVYGFDTDGLDERWREYVRKRYPPPVARLPAAAAVLAAAYPFPSGASEYLLKAGLN